MTGASYQPFALGARSGVAEIVGPVRSMFTGGDCAVGAAAREVDRGPGHALVAPSWVKVISSVALFGAPVTSRLPQRARPESASAQVKRTVTPGGVVPAVLVRLR